MKPLILQSDFGLQDGAVSAMYGVAYTVCPELRVFDLTHDIAPFDIWEASCRLIQTIDYWPEGTVFVSVVDPGVGTSRRSVVARTRTGRYIITPDNGTLTHVKKHLGLDGLRVIDERKNRLAGSADSYTFHGRDIFAYTGARLAAGMISFEEIGPEQDPASAVELPTFPASINEERTAVTGAVDMLDVRFGSLWTDIPKSLFCELGLKPGDRAEVTVENNRMMRYRGMLTFARSFGEVAIGEPLIYINSLDCIAIAINQGSFTSAYNIGTGSDWHITVRKI